MTGGMLYVCIIPPVIQTSVNFSIFNLHFLRLFLRRFLKLNSHTPKMKIHIRQKLCQPFSPCVARAKLFSLKTVVLVTGLDCSYEKVFNAVKCNLTELISRSTSFTLAVSGLLYMRMRQDSSCSWSIAHCSVWLAFLSEFLALEFLLSVGTPWRLFLGCFLLFLPRVFLRTCSSAGCCKCLIFWGVLQITDLRLNTVIDPTSHWTSEQWTLLARRLEYH